MKERPIRKLQRLRGFDYSKDGVYFVTICTDNRKCFLGEISTNEPIINQLSSLGLIVENAIKEIPFHHKDVQIFTYVVMPNHVHLLLEIDWIDSLTPPSNLSTIVSCIKATVSKTAKEVGIKEKIWQKSFTDHIIRDELDLQTHQDYILANEERWREDEYCNVN